MQALVRHPLRVTGRLLWLAGEIITAGLTFVLQVPLRSNPSPLAIRTRWLQAACRRTLRIFGTEIISTGPVPNGGLLVSNHLSYMDILVFVSLTPAVFVAKREVKSWPIFGWFASLGGTVFADREKRTQVGQVTEAIRAAMDKGALVILFPEGTSSDGQTVLPFKSSLLEPAVGCAYPVRAGWIGYDLEDGDAGEEVCYWKDMTFAPHLLNLLSKRRLRATVRFSSLQPDAQDRKDLARQLHAEVSRLKDARS